MLTLAPRIELQSLGVNLGKTMCKIRNQNKWFTRTPLSLLSLFCFFTGLLMSRNVY